MNVLNIRLRTACEIKNPSVIVDGKILNLTEKKESVYSCRYETEKDSVELTVCKLLEINEKFWFLYSLLFFFISLLGIFDARYDNTCRCLRYKTVLTLSGENTFTMKFNRFIDGKPAINCTKDCSAEILENEYFTDKQAKKRLKTMRIVKLLCCLAAIIIAVIVIIYKVIGF